MATIQQNQLMTKSERISQGRLAGPRSIETRARYRAVISAFARVHEADRLIGVISEPRIAEVLHQLAAAPEAADVAVILETTDRLEAFCLWCRRNPETVRECLKG